MGGYAFERTMVCYYELKPRIQVGDALSEPSTLVVPLTHLNK